MMAETKIFPSPIFRPGWCDDGRYSFSRSRPEPGLDLDFGAKGRRISRQR